MEIFNLRELMNSEIKFSKLWESSCKNHRILYFQIDSEAEDIPVHFHPNGEDNAIVLQGKLTYDVKFEEQINAFENDIVFGWTNYVHGYHNKHSIPLHILIFATPENNWSVFDKDKLPEVIFNEMRIKNFPQAMIEIESTRMIFSSGKMDTYKDNTFSFNWHSKELRKMKSNDTYPLITPESLYIQFK